MLKIIFYIFIITLSFNYVYAQSFGFGCFGFVGGYGGYSYQQFQPGLLNDYVINFNASASKKIESFTRADGYRFGLNFFRANFSGFFLTAKGYYQQLDESHYGQKIDFIGEVNYDYDFKLKSFGVGLDLGIPISTALHLKIFDGAVLINSARLTELTNSINGTSVQKFNNEKTELGYSIGSGFVIDIIKNYISIEGIAGYSYIKIQKMKSNEGIQFKDIFTPADDNQDFIKAGGFSAVIQLNVGFPL